MKDSIVDWIENGQHDTNNQISSFWDEKIPIQEKGGGIWGGNFLVIDYVAAASATSGDYIIVGYLPEMNPSCFVWPLHFYVRVSCVWEMVMTFFVPELKRLEIGRYKYLKFRQDLVLDESKVEGRRILMRIFQFNGMAFIHEMSIWPGNSETEHQSGLLFWLLVTQLHL